VRGTVEEERGRKNLRIFCGRKGEGEGEGGR
jgi:hypothetical protein